MSYNIDPEFVPMLEFLPVSDFSDPQSARTQMDSFITEMLSGIDESGVTIENRFIPGPEGAPEVSLRVYSPADLDAVTAGLVYIHGGGFAVGSLDSEHAGVVALCRDLGIVIVSVGYRLAPENPYPAGLEDCYAALQWAQENAEALKIDPKRLGIMGGSAGGGLSAGLALLAKQRGGPAICFQFLGIPELDDRLTTVSMQEFTDTPMWNNPNAIHSWNFYLGDDYQRGGDSVPITAAPARASVEDLRDLPPACVTTMEFDPLRDEGIEYALKLLQAGVSVELHSYPGTFHGSSMMPDAAISRRENNDTRAVLRRGLKLD